MFNLEAVSVYRQTLYQVASASASVSECLMCCYSIHVGLLFKI